MSDHQRTVISKHVDDMLTRGIIQHSVSPWAAPVVLVKKKDGTDRFCVDYRRLNQVTFKDSYPLPRISDIIDTMSGSQYFSTIDLLSGCWQIELEPETREKTAFIINPGGLFEFTKMPFGLCNAPATFQRLMESILKNLTYKIALCYIDDIVIYSKSFPQHILDLKEVFQRLRDANIKLKAKKCKFAARSVEYLGHVISHEGVRPNPEKINAVRDFPVPKNTKSLKSFLGLSNYYRRFVRDFAKIASPLNALTRKSVRFQWTQECQQAFDTLKKALISAPILAYPNFTLPFQLHVDASDTAIGYVLAQVQDDKEVVIAYGGRDLNPAERNYSATEREALSVVFAIKRNHPYLHNKRFLVITDHAALAWLMKLKDPTGRLARWSLLLQMYDFEIRHRPGIKNGNADALSRRPYTQINACDPPPSSVSRVLTSQSRDQELHPIIRYLQCDELPQNDEDARKLLLEVDNYVLDDNGLLYHISVPPPRTKQDPVVQLVVPRDLRHEIIYHCHDSPLAGHFGLQKTYAKIRTRYFWKGMYRDCEVWIRSCIDCSMKKSPRTSKTPICLPIPVSGAFDRLAVDAVGPLPETHAGNRYLIVFTDYLTRWPEAFPVKTIDAPVVARLIMDEIVARHGAPRTLLSDRGKNFLSKLVKEVCHMINTRKVNTSSYHPQTNGLVERFNGVLVQALSHFCSDNQKDWDLYIPSVLFGYRTSPSAATGESPFYLLYGREARLPIDVSLLPPTNVSSKIREHRARIVRNIKLSHEI